MKKDKRTLEKVKVILNASEPIMNKRIYKHICKECETVFYVESLRLISACYCPSCHKRGLYIGEFRCVQ